MKAADLTKLAKDWLVIQYPESVIVTEFSVASWGGASIDIAAITADEIIGVEIKGEGDSPSRLPLQGHIYSRVASRMWLLPDASIELRCEKVRPSGWGRLEVFGHKIRPFNRHTINGDKIKVNNGCHIYETYNRIRSEDEYIPSEANPIIVKCPWAMCGTLWRDELYDLAIRCGIILTKSARENEIVDAITSKLPAPQINKEMIRALNNRQWRKPVFDMRHSLPVGNQGILL